MKKEVILLLIALFGVCLICGCTLSPLLSKSYTSTDFKFQINYPEEYKVQEFAINDGKMHLWFFDEKHRFYGFTTNDFNIEIDRNCSNTSLPHQFNKTEAVFDQVLGNGFSIPYSEYSISHSTVGGYPSKRETIKTRTDVIIDNNPYKVRVTEYLVKDGICYSLRQSSDEPHFDYRIYNNMVGSIKFI